MCTYVFFFFQAEDGIRDYKVTGVQTCALPISLVEVLQQRTAAGQDDAAVDNVGGQLRGRALERDAHRVHDHVDGFGERLRSEERRVGKEGRSGSVGAD